MNSIKRNQRFPSSEIPGGLEAKETPQFVTFGFDDNKSLSELEWIYEFSSTRRNYDGSPITFSFYNSNIDKENIFIWKKLSNQGHEIGNHSFSHCPGHKTCWEKSPIEYSSLMDTEDWIEEISKTENIIKNSGLEKNKIFGFRTPFLCYTDDTLQAINKLGYEYDCSIEEGHEEDMDGSNYVWPYTLDSGSPGDRALFSYISGRKPLDNYPGLWELPVYLLVIPDDDLSELYQFRKGLQRKIGIVKPYVQENNWKITGFDYNLFYTDNGAPLLDSDEVLAVWKYNLDLRLYGNKVPLMIGAHSQEYYSSERRGIIERFVDHVLSIPQVQIKNQYQILEWIKSPTAVKPTKKNYKMVQNC